MDIREYIKGSFITLKHLDEGPRREVIALVTTGKYDKPNVKSESGDLLSLNATNARVLAKSFGVDTDRWIGKRVELFTGELEFQGRMQEAVLVRAISPAMVSSVTATSSVREHDDLSGVDPIRF
jgi:hypothetical protein